MRRLAGFLARKGYPESLSRQVVRELLAADTQEAGDRDEPGAAGLDEDGRRGLSP